MLADILESDKYHVLQELGRGGMGVVYLAEDQQLKRQVALKVLYDHLNNDADFVARFQEEARSVSTLHHPNIVCVHGLERTNGVVAIDMEYVEGQSLDQLVATTRMTPHMAVGIAHDVLSGLATCHDIGIIHRDIKPNNILINRGGTAKLTDFGLATAYASHLENSIRKGKTSSGFYMGTPRYMPVQAWEGGEPQPFWDLYSFGLVFYELLTGDVVFQGDNPMAIMRKHLTAPLPSIRTVTHGLSGELTDLVDALIQSPDTPSPMTSDEALDALQKIPEYAELRDSNSATTVAVPRIRRSWLAKRRMRIPRKKVYGSLAFVALLSVGFAGFTMLQINRKTETKGGTGNTPIPLIAATTGEQFMTMKVVGGPGSEKGTWMITPGATGGSLVLNGFSPTGLTRLTAQPNGDGDWTLSGGWAESVVPQAGSMQFGIAQGMLHWPGGNTDMHISLEHVRERDGERVQLTLAGTPAPPEYSRQAFLRAFEGDELRQNLLYSELLPRRLDWATKMEAILPSQTNSRYFIPFADGNISVDGVLDETMWMQRYFRPGIGPVGELVSHRPRMGTTLRARWNHNAVCLATQISSSPSNAQLEVAILPAFEVSLQDSGRFLLGVDAVGNKRFRYFLGNVEEPSDYAWPLEVHEKEGTRTVEMEIPIEILEENALPKAGKRWRVNVQWFREGDNGKREVLAQWGDDDIMSLAHGALFVFDGGNG
ncbi:MAG: serine/threonine protein kinase [Candidatus Hydrogenedentes bacterium]|nr:serine/threonine protein kinase [Candidatus Hydrogenedentota bacterium]